MRHTASTITIRGERINVPTGVSKADLARVLLEEGYTVNEIAKAVPMAYSQVRSIDQKMGVGIESMESMAKRTVPTAKQRAADARATRAAHKVVADRMAGKPTKTPRVGKLRTPGFPSDIEVGECANCGFDLVVRKMPTGVMLIHTNTTPEEYLAITQFCTAVPSYLLRNQPRVARSG